MSIEIFWTVMTFSYKVVNFVHAFSAIWLLCNDNLINKNIVVESLFDLRYAERIINSSC